MAIGPRVDCMRILNEIVKAGKLRDMVPDGRSKPELRCQEELLAALRADRLALTDWAFRCKYLEYIKQ